MIPDPRNEAGSRLNPGPRRLRAGALGLALLAGCGGSPKGVVVTAQIPESGISVALARVGPASLAIGGATLLTATVSGATNTAVTWTVDGRTQGDSSTGSVLAPIAGNTVVFTAPAAAGTHTVTATSVADGTRSASLTFTVGDTVLQASTIAVGANVKAAPFNAKGDGVTDDTAAIMAAVKAVAGTGKAVVVPTGTYRINPVANSGVGILMGSNMTLLMEQGAVLEALPTSTMNYQMVRVNGCQNVNISGGIIKGNNGNNSIPTPTTVENGNGIQILNSTNVVVEGTTFQDCFCDGIYIASSSANVVLCDVTCQSNRRNGMSIVQGSRIAVSNSRFNDNTGSVEVAGSSIANGSGIDIEPNANQSVGTILVSGCTLANNYSHGLCWGIGASTASGTSTSSIFAIGNVASGNGRGFDLVNCTDSAIIGNTVRANRSCGIYIHDGATRTVCSGNTVSGTLSSGDGAGIECYKDTATVVNANTSTGNHQYGILVISSTGPTITNNSCAGNGTAPLRITSSTGVTSSGNTP